VEAAAPELAAKVRARFDASGLGYLATLRRDGSPRISGQETLFWEGELWLGMMDQSRKQLDIERDPRIAIHAANADKNVAEGDARVSGLAVRVTDAATFARYREAFAGSTGQEPPEEFPLYRVEISEAMHLRPVVDHLLIEWWTPAKGAQSVKRY
jgi:hypothetical protein